MVETALTYLQRGQSGIFAEVYFPRRIAAQGTIFTALEEGYDEVKVKDYLQKIADVLTSLTPYGMMYLREENKERPKKTQMRGLPDMRLHSSVGQTMWWTEFGLMMMGNHLKKQPKSSV